MIQRLNDALDGTWSFEITHHEVREDEVIVLGKLTAEAIAKMAFGTSQVTRERESGQLVSLGDDLKAAATDSVVVNIDDTDLQDFLQWFFWTGMRPGEIRNLTWEGFDQETWTLRLHAKDAKTGYGRVLPLEDELRAVLERRIKARRLDCRHIFHRAGRPVGEFRKTWARACKAAGLAVTAERDGKEIIRPLRLPYDLRRTAVRNMVRGGTDPAVAMKISGHRTRSVFDRYNIISEEDLRAAVKKTTAYVATLPTTSNVIPLRAVEGGRS